ncbi:MAG: hypothetical protein AABZ06_02485 [Bdellovibrionota bacterium]
MITEKEHVTKTEQRTENHTGNQGRPTEPPEEKRIPINGFRQVLDMLRIADPTFRESLLSRLALRDKALARALRQELNL